MLFFEKQPSRKNSVERTCRNFRQTVGLSLYISASKTDIEERIREVPYKLSRDPIFATNYFSNSKKLVMRINISMDRLNRPLGWS